MNFISQPLLDRDRPNREKKRKYLEGNLIRRLLLSWVSDLVDFGNRVTFQQSMHWDLRDEDNVEKNLESFLALWKKTPNPSLMKTLFSINKWTLIYGIFMSFLSAIFDYVGPILLNFIVLYVQDTNRKISTGILLISGTVLSRILQAITYSQSSLYTELTGIRFKVGINSAIYNKALKFPLIRSMKHSTGSLINNLQVDSEKIYLLAMTTGGSIILPLQILIGILMLVYLVGWAIWTGLVVIIFMGCVNYCLGRIYFKYQREVMQKKDHRIKITNEIFSGIKYIKMSGWEEIFIEKVTKSRESELSSLKKQYLTNCFTIFSLWLTPMLVATAIFGTYVFSGNTLTPAKAFTIMSILGILQYPIRFLPSMIVLILEAVVSSKRIEKFLKDEELQSGCIIYKNDPDSLYSVKISNGNFYWKEKINNDDHQSISAGQVMPEPEPEPDNERLFALNGVNLNVKKGEFIVLIGDVGSGKSSILNAILGEMKYPSDNPPQVEINGSLGYVGQQAWIQNNTLRDNILFGNPWDEEKYKEAIFYSNLEQDIAILIKGDQTEIGEKGVNLSGGQKARLSLARAIYSNPEIFLLDDPLSAVDAHVGSMILKETLANYLRGKTRILITHKFESLKYADYAYIFQNGSIIESGTYEEIRQTEAFQFIEKKAKLKRERSLSQISDESSGDLEKLIQKPNRQPKDTFVMSLENELEETIEDTEEKKIMDKLMLNEDREVGVVGSKIWKTFFDYYGGLKYFSIVIIVMLCWITLMTSSNIWLAEWARNIGSGEHSNEYYFTIFSILALTFSVFCFLRAALLFFQSIECSRTLHKDMISKVIRAPLNLFFDRIPIGRILNRYSKDLTVIDNYLAATFGSLGMSFFCFFADLFICILAGSIWVMPVIIIFGILGIYFQMRYMKVRREIIRLGELIIIYLKIREHLKKPDAELFY